MRAGFVLLSMLISAGNVLAATDVRIDFTLNTTDAYGAAPQQKRFYYVYRPDNLPKSPRANDPGDR